MNPNRARDHLANERTFLAWLRTGIAVAVFGTASIMAGVALAVYLVYIGFRL